MGEKLRPPGFSGDVVFRGQYRLNPWKQNHFRVGIGGIGSKVIFLPMMFLGSLYRLAILGGIS
jgi:hypothetical protein